MLARDRFFRSHETPLLDSEVMIVMDWESNALYFHIGLVLISWDFTLLKNSYCFLLQKRQEWPKIKSDTLRLPQKITANFHFLNFLEVRSQREVWLKSQQFCADAVPPMSSVSFFSRRQLLSRKIVQLFWVEPSGANSKYFCFKS